MKSQMNAQKNAQMNAQLNQACRAMIGYLAIVMATIMLSGCGDSAAPTTTQRLLLTGSSTMAPLMTEMAAAYERQNPEVRIDVQTGGSSRGIMDARRGLADIGMVSRSLNDQEADLRAHLVAQDGIGLILNAANPVSELTSSEVVSIYTGATDNWQRFGGENRQITVVSKAEGRSTLELFLAYFKQQSRRIKAHIVIGDNEQGIKAVAGNVNAIAYVSIGAAEYSIRAGVPIKLLPMAGVEASTAAVGRGEFPLSRSLNLVTPAEPANNSTALVNAFIQFAQSQAVRELVLEQYFAPPGP